MARAGGLPLFVVVNLILFAGLVASAAGTDALKATFSMGGIKGDVTFSQSQGQYSSEVMVNLTGVSATLKWSIRQLPMIYNGNANLSCKAGAVGGVFDPKMAEASADYETNCQLSNSLRFQSCAVGDLSRMLGNLDSNKQEYKYSDSGLMIPISGPYSVMGKALVLYDGDMPKACALIAPTQPMKTFVAVFKGPVAGFVYFRQVDENSDTSVFVDLFFVNGTNSNKDFSWQINQGVVSHDASDPSSYCKKVGQIFNPKNMNDASCSKTMHGKCAIGDMTSKHGKIEVSLATKMQSSTKAAFTDTNLPLSGDDSVQGETLLLFPSDPIQAIACAKIVRLEPKTLKVSFDGSVQEGVTGHFMFTQSSPFDATTAEIKLTGLNKKAQGYHIHAYPSPSYMHLLPNESCTGLIAGDHWNPYNVDIKTSPPAGTGTDDEYEVGDLSGKYGTFLNRSSFSKTVMDYNLPMFGRNSIQGRSLVIHKLKIQDANMRWVCNDLMPEVDKGITYFMKAIANISGPAVKGMVVLEQYLSSSPNVAEVESTIYINIEHSQDSESTSGHRYGVHKNPVGEDASYTDVSRRCMSLEGNFNPYAVYTKGDYSSTCSPTNMLRCESGDLSGKHDPLEVGDGRVFFNDVNLPLFGIDSVAGHGIAVNAKDGGSDRIGCANLIVEGSLYAERSLEFPKKAAFSSFHFADIISKALGIPKWRLFMIRTEEGSVSECMKVKFAIVGNANQVIQPVTKFDDLKQNNPEEFKPYTCNPSTTSGLLPDPSTTSGALCYHSSFLLSIIVVVVVAFMG